MKKHAAIIAPKFALVNKYLEEGLGDLGIAKWTKPNGGYFISFYAESGCAKRIYTLAKEAGLTMTTVGATYPMGYDPEDSNIRIAPTFPSMNELEAAMQLFVVCVKLATLEKYLA